MAGISSGALNQSYAGMNFTAGGLGNINNILSTKSTANATIFTFDETQSLHEMDKQAEDNFTFLFEYKALLNSKLTTLTTALTTAYTSDLDNAMSRTGPPGNANLWQGRTAMQGYTGLKHSVTSEVLLDPGAARTTYGYLQTWASVTDSTAHDAGANVGDWTGTGGANPEDQIAQQSTSVRFNYNSNSTGIPANEQATGTEPLIGPDSEAVIGGTTTFQTGGGDSSILLDSLFVNVNNVLPPTTGSISITGATAPNLGDTISAGGTNAVVTSVTGAAGNFIVSFTFTNGSSFQIGDNLGAGRIVQSIGPSFFKNVKEEPLEPESFYQNKNIGNNFEQVLFNFFRKRENMDVLRFGLFEDVFVVGTSSLPTGSQVQGTIKLGYKQKQGRIDIFQERYAAFYHS